MMKTKEKNFPKNKKTHDDRRYPFKMIANFRYKF